MYIKKFEDYIEDQEITFTNNFDISFNNGVLEVKKAKNNLSEFYSSNVKNITLLIGKNGTGKTTLLKQILGMNRSDRFRNSVRNNKIINEYFILFYLGKNQDGKEVFGIEFTGYENIIKSIKNLEMSQDDSNYRISKNCIGV